MGSLSDSLGITTSAMQAHSTRLKHISENLANSDTPGYRRKTVSFQSLTSGEIEVGRTRLDQTQLPRVHDPSHPLADSDGYYDGTNVNLIFELNDAREAQRSYEANLKIFEQTKSMSSKLYTLLRR